jgi:hypothetical protein
LDDEPIVSIRAEAVGLEPTIRRGGHLFSGQVPHPCRMTSRFVILQSSGGWNRTNGLLGQNQASLPAATAPEQICKIKTTALPSSSGRRGRTFVSWFKARQPTASRSPITFTKSALRESNPPNQLGGLVPLPLGQGHNRHSGRRGSRTLKAFLVLDRFRDGCHRQLACPSVSIASCGGWSRTSNCLLNRELPYRLATPQSTSQDGGI